MIPQEEVAEIIELSCSTIYKRKDGILVFRLLPGKTVVSLDEVKNQLQAFLKIQKGERSPLMTVVNQLQKLDNDQKMYMNAHVAEFASKFCIVTDSAIPTFIYNIIFYLSPPPVPSKILKTEEDAIEWLKKTI
jgi:hypothetical protein